MDKYEENEKHMCEFKKYIKRVLDLMVDSYKWKKLAEFCDTPEEKNKYMEISNTLFNMYEEEYNEIIRKYKEE